jgi:hypothetical protein
MAASWVGGGQRSGRGRQTWCRGEAIPYPAPNQALQQTLTAFALLTARALAVHN